MNELFPKKCEKPEVQALVDRARKHNDKLDKIDRDTGFAIPSEGDVASGLRTCLTALECAMGMKDWDVVAEAFCILQDIECRIRPDYRKEGTAGTIRRSPSHPFAPEK